MGPECTTEHGTEMKSSNGDSPCGRRPVGGQDEKIGEFPHPTARRVTVSESSRTDRFGLSRSTRTDGRVMYECYCEGTTERCPHHDTRQLRYTRDELLRTETMG